MDPYFIWSAIDGGGSILDVHGPCLAVDTACSGGLVALDQGMMSLVSPNLVATSLLAVRHLQSGQGETALVCAANAHTW